MGPRIAAGVMAAALALGCDGGSFGPTQLGWDESCLRSGSADGTEAAAPGWTGWESARVIGHRGFAGYSPENTLPAIRTAVAAGAQAVELDVRTTRDDVLVLMHDPTIDRTTDRSGEVRRLLFRQIRSANACVGSQSACEVPTLQEALMVARGNTRVVLDVKPAPSCGLIASIALAVSEVSMEAEVAMISGDLRQLEIIRALRPTTPIGLYLDPESSADIAASEVIPPLIALGQAEFFLPARDVVARTAALDLAIVNGIPIVPWTIHRPAEVERFLETPGVSRVLSDVLGAEGPGS